MANPFDQFDAPSANPFDQFDAPAVNPALDVAKQIGSGLVTGTEAIPAFPAQMAGLAGAAVDKLAPGLVSPEAQKQQQDLRALIAANRGEGIANYLPKAETPAGETAGYISQFIPTALGMPGGLLKNAAIGALTGTGAKVGSEVGGPTGEVAGALIGGAAGIKAAEKAAARAIPTETNLKSAAQNAYTVADQHAAQIPVSSLDMDILKAHLKDALHTENFREANVKGIYDEIAKLPDGGDVADLLNLRRGLRDLKGQEGAAASLAMPRVEAAIDYYAPGTTKLLEMADKNYNAYKISEELSRRFQKAQKQSDSANSGMNLENKLRQAAVSISTNPQQARYMRPDEIAALDKLSGGTFTRNSLRTAGNLLGGGGGIGTTLLAGLGLQKGGEYLGHPELGMAPFIGMGLRGLSNRLAARQAAQIGEIARARSPEAIMQGLPTFVSPTGTVVNNPYYRPPQLNPGIMGSAIYAKPTYGGLLGP